MEKGAIVKASPTEVTFVMPDTESLGSLKRMAPEFSLTLKYKKAEDWALLKGQEVRAFYMGMKEIPNKRNELVVCGIFVSEYECFLSGAKLLIEAVRHLAPRTPVSIVYKEKKSNQSTEGETMVFDVSILKPAIK